jgi:threonine aldolase
VSETIVELRSDTFTIPTEEMLSAVSRAPLGDDVYGEDPTVRLLEEKAADLLGKQAACLTPSGTMANLAALMAHAPRGSRVLAGRDSDIYAYEAHGVSVCGGVALDPVDIDADGRVDLAHASRLMPEDPDDPQFSVPSVLCVENTANRSGGIPLSLSHLRDVAEFAARHSLAVHMDGARVFNAAIALGTSAAGLARFADSVQFCLSKGLSAPVGSMVVGSAEFVSRVRRIRKMLGGGMRQAGVIAAAGIVALDNMIDRLVEDHEHARRLAEGLARIPGLSLDPRRVQTNIVVFSIDPQVMSHAEFISSAAEHGVRLAELGVGRIRAVTHRGVSRSGIDHAIASAKKILRDRA